MPGWPRVVVSLLYWALRRLLELLVPRVRSERANEVEILVLRHQLRVLERQVGRPRFEPTIRDGDSKFTRDFDEVFRSEGIQVIKAPVRAPKARRMPSAGSKACAANASTGC